MLDCCPGVPVVFDNGNVEFGGLNMPRADFVAPPPNDFSNAPNMPLGTLFPFLTELGEPASRATSARTTG